MIAALDEQDGQQPGPDGKHCQVHGHREGREFTGIVGAQELAFLRPVACPAHGIAPGLAGTLSVMAGPNLACWSRIESVTRTARSSRSCRLPVSSTQECPAAVS